VNPQAIKSLEIALGVNNHQGVVQQYFSYLWNLLHGDLGVSLGFFPEHVSTVIMVALPWTLGLVGVATVIAFVLGTLIGILGAWRRGGVLDSVLPPVFVVISAFPYFWVGLICILIFAITLGWFPQAFGSSPELTSEFSWPYISDVLYHAILPGFTIVLTSIGGWILTMRNNMITTLAEDYIKMARAKGLSPTRIMLQYAARNAILPNLVGFAMSLGFVISGALLVEIVFNYPGLGTFLLQAVNNEDFSLMQALFLLITLAVLLAVMAADFLTAWLDPRTRERA
jgi:peptide/nickel transport system permease protein